MKLSRVIFYTIILFFYSSVLYSYEKPKIEKQSDGSYKATIQSSKPSEKCSQLVQPLLRFVDDWCAKRGGKKRAHGNVWCDESASWVPFIGTNYGYLRFDLEQPRCYNEMKNPPTVINTESPIEIDDSYCGSIKRLGECDRISSYDGVVSFQIIDIQGHPGGKTTVCGFLTSDNWDAEKCNQNTIVIDNDSETSLKETAYYLKVTGKTTNEKKVYFQVCKRKIN